MSSNEVRLRGRAKRRVEEYPLGDIPDRIVQGIARLLIHRLSIGQPDISGDDFGTIFADAIDGHHRESPLGLSDVVKGSCAWSVKTIKHANPHAATKIRLISGRNSPDYSLGISDPRADAQLTGDAVLKIWNARINEALQEHRDLRVFVLVRNFEKQSFLVFEEEVSRYSTGDFNWGFNSRGNLEGLNIADNEHRFTWQPSGAQFTILRPVPAHARKFSIRNKIPLLPIDEALEIAGYRDDWVLIE